ncbi:MAG: adenylate kinase [Anaerolineales bacterium]
MNIIFLGAPGSGKGTQATILEQKLGLVHVASGDLFRYNLKNRTELGILAEKYMSVGQLVPDDVTVAMIKERLQRPDVTSGVVLDGFPRTRPQAEALDAMLAEMKTRIDLVLYLKVPDEEIISRLAGRWICKECQTPFHEVNNPFQACPSGKCKGEYLYQREDDKPETVRARLKVYNDQTSPLVDYYRARGLLVEIPGVGELEEITARLLQALNIS